MTERFYALVQTHSDDMNIMQEFFVGPFYKPGIVQTLCEKFEKRAKEVNLLNVRARATNIDPEDIEGRYLGKMETADEMIQKVLRAEQEGGHFDHGGEGGH